jgi:hypothetical protein
MVVVVVVVIVVVVKIIIVIIVTVISQSIISLTNTKENLTLAAKCSYTCIFNQSKGLIGM